MLARTLEGRIVLARRTGLRDVRNLVPHDRVDHLEPLPRDGLRRFAVRHAALAAPRVVLAPPPVGSGEAVAREDKQVLQALVALPGRRHRRHRSPDWRLRGASPQYDASLSWFGKSSMFTGIASSDAVFGPIPGMVSRHR